jgi:hypothetical protein
MIDSATLPRTLLVYSLSLIMAVVLGFVLATPTDFFTLVLVFLVTLLLATPLLMRWHHLALVFSLHAAVQLMLLPGQPNLWMLMCGISFGFALLQRTLDKQSTFIHVPAVAWSLILLGVVVLATAKLTGGVGLRMLGSGVYGGKRYYMTLAAIVVYFALVSQRIAPARASFYIGLFFLSETTAVLSNLAYWLGPSFWFLYAFFSPELAMHQIRADYVVEQVGFARLLGLSSAGNALFCYLLVRYGIRQVINFGQPLRLALFLAVVAVTLLGGFRSVVVFFLLLVATLFYLEKLYRTRTFLLLLALGALSAMVILPNATRLPLAAQRSLSILPFVKVSPVAQWDAQASSEWRLTMWKLLVPEIPKRLLVGKGYAIDPTELYLTEESIKRGLAPAYETSLIAGDYHNGPLSVVIPFGLGGVLMFGFFCLASLRVLYNNWRYGLPEHHTYNVFFLAWFIAKLIFFVLVFGALSSDLVMLTSVVGLNISLNGGVCRKAQILSERSALQRAPAGSAGAPGRRANSSAS